MASHTYYKCTRPDGSDFHTGTVNYAEALAKNLPLIHPNPEGKTDAVCGRGYHVSSTPRQTIQFANSSFRPWRWWEVLVDEKHLIQSDIHKSRVSELIVSKEITLEDIFGKDFAARVEGVKQEIKTWKDIPWLKPSPSINLEQIQTLFSQWQYAVLPWVKSNIKLPNKLKIINDAAAADAAAAYAAADADAATKYWRGRWYVQPRYVLWRCERWKLAGMTQPNLWAPLVAMFKLGCQPIGYVEGEFVVYVPKPNS